MSCVEGTGASTTVVASVAGASADKMALGVSWFAVSAVDAVETFSSKTGVSVAICVLFSVPFNDAGDVSFEGMRDTGSDGAMEGSCCLWASSVGVSTGGVFSAEGVSQDKSRRCPTGESVLVLVLIRVSCPLRYQIS